MIHFNVKSPELFARLQAMLREGPFDCAKIAVQQSSGTEAWRYCENGDVFIVMDIANYGCKPLQAYAKMEEEIKKHRVEIRLFRISVHGNSRFLLKSALSQAYRELCQTFERKLDIGNFNNIMRQIGTY